MTGSISRRLAGLLGLVVFATASPGLASSDSPAETGVEPAQDAVAAYNQIVALLAQDRIDEAAAHARALAAMPARTASQRETVGAALYNAALGFLTRGQPTIARELLERITASLPGTSAATSAAELLARAPDRAAPDTATCIADYRDQKFRAARDCFRDLVAASGPDSELLYAIGYASYQLGDYRPAIAAFEQALVIRPRDGDVLFMLAMARAHKGDHAIALDKFRAAVAAGLEAEDPAEAERYIASLKKLLATRITGGWMVSADAAAGYDSYPLPTGGAAAATSSFGEEVAGSGFSTLRAGFGYRWPRYGGPSGGLAALTSAGYQLSQYLLFSDFGSAGGRGHGMLSATSLSDLSLQTHGVYLVTRHRRGAWTFGGRTAAGLELGGVSDFDPLLVTTSLAPELEYRWGRRTVTGVTAGFTPQWSLATDLDPLAGQGLFVEALHSFRPHPRLSLRAGYRLTSWWLGRYTGSASDCPAGETCAIDVPYSHYSHRPALGLALDAGAMLILAEGALEQRVYQGDGVYIQRDGSSVTAHRTDLAEVATVTASFSLGPHTELSLDAAYTHNDSTIDTETSGSEGYDRLVIGAQLAYRP